MNRLPSRDDCPTCNERRDELGRLPVGFCGPDCLMSKLRAEQLARIDEYLDEGGNRPGPLRRLLAKVRSR